MTHQHTHTPQQPPYGKFLALLYGRKPGTSYVLIWTLSKKRSAWFQDLKKAEEHIEMHSDDVYVGVGLSDEDRGPKKRCESDKIIGIPGLYVDIDLKGPTHKQENLPETLEEALKLVKGHGFDPTVIVHTGHGIHAWWLFKEPWTFDSDEERERAALLSQRTHHTVNNRAVAKGWSIDSVFDLSRVLRLPGTYNCKNGDKVETKLLELNDDRRYNPEDLEELLDEGPAKPQQVLPGSGSSQTEPALSALPKIDRKRILGLSRELEFDPNAEPGFDQWNALKANFPEVEDTYYERRIDMRDKTPSGYDMSLASLAMKAEWTEQDALNLLIAHRREHGHDLKLGNKQYYARTILNAKSSAVSNEAGQEMAEEPVTSISESAHSNPDPNQGAATSQVHSTESNEGSGFPFSVFTGAASCFADVYGDYIEAPVEFLFMAYLTCLGAVITRCVSVASAVRPQPRLFTVLVGQSSTDRKSTTLKVVTEHFRDVVSGFSPCWGVGSAEGLQKVLISSDDRSATPGDLLVFDELKSFVSKCRIEASVLLPAVSTLFESNRFESHTKKTSVSIDNAHLSVLGASTLPTYERIYDSAFIDIGFPNRVFLVVGTAKRRFAFPKKVPDADAKMLRTNLVRIMKHVHGDLELKITPAADKLYQQWYMDLDTSVHARRLDTYSLRLMMILAVNDLKSKIDKEVVEQAIALCDWQLDVRKTYDPIDADSTMATMEEKIRRVLKQRGPMKNRDLMRYTNASKTGLWYYKTAIDNLRSVGDIAYESKTQTYSLSA